MKNKKWYILGLSSLFVLLTILVLTKVITGFDTFSYNIITFFSNDIITMVYKGITFLGSTEFIVFLCIFFLILFIYLRKRNIGFIITGVVIISTIINNVLKVIVRRERPLVEVLVEEHTFSYPSGHTMASVTMYGILIYIVLKSNLNKKLKITLSIILGLIPILVGLSRIYLGAHFMSDVIGSFLVSIILLLIETSFIDDKNWLD